MKASIHANSLDMPYLHWRTRPMYFLGVDSFVERSFKNVRAEKKFCMRTQISRTSEKERTNFDAYIKNEAYRQAPSSSSTFIL